MKKLIKFLIISVVIVSLAFGLFKIANKRSISVSNENIDWEIKYKDVKNARSFEIDNKGYIYIAFKNHIKIINNDNSESKIIQNSNFDIYDIEIYKDNIIIATDNRILKYNQDEKVFEEIINDIPNEGLNKEIKLLVNEDKLFIAIGSNTNSGIVDDESGKRDIASFEWILNGENYGDKNTGAFLEYGISSSEGQIIKEEKISNASIIYYDFISKDIRTYAAGLRSIEGFDFNSEGKLISIVSGMKNVGLRPISDDKDYIYEIRESYWYGWPDFSGGDSISSPRFSEDGTITNRLIKNPIIEVPCGPLYQHYNVNSLKGLAIDKDGKYLSKGDIIFADNNEKYIYQLNNNIKGDLIKLKQDSYVEKIRCYDDGIYILDSGVGELYRIQDKNLNIMNLPNIIWVFIIIFILTIIMILILKFKKK